MPDPCVCHNAILELLTESSLSPGAFLFPSGVSRGLTEVSRWLVSSSPFLAITARWNFPCTVSRSIFARREAFGDYCAVIHPPLSAAIHPADLPLMLSYQSMKSNLAPCPIWDKNAGVEGEASGPRRCRNRRCLCLAHYGLLILPKAKM